MPAKPTSPWIVAPTPVGSAEAVSLLLDYLLDVSNSYYQHHHGRPALPDEVEPGLTDYRSEDLAPPTGLFLVGRRDGEPAGCAGLRVLTPDTVELTRMFIRPAHRGTGGGGRLLAAAEHAARGLGARRIWLDTRLDLTEARALYLRHGFVEIPLYKDDPYAEICYGKELDAAPDVRPPGVRTPDPGAVGPGAFGPGGAGVTAGPASPPSPSR
ncbi:GNAT family N-acetyltransferase [Wenjunlia vitaminophila]|uniref:GNAT family N-acetyltransferase n=1 Tax=Wenjunlia vitaminophila TaxID=76728 RepID=UPI000382AF20|nr:GNAT family N-acetyltransferase [Wenjunlia vitaminophila]